MQSNRWLVTGGILSAAAALLHIAIIFGGPSWYRYFGAGEGMARAAEAGSARPTMVTIGIAFVLLVWAMYAFSGAGRIRPLPLLRTGLILISAIYLVRALAPIPLLIAKPHLVDAFVIWSSLVVLVYGVCYAVGTWTAWPHISASRGQRSVA